MYPLLPRLLPIKPKVGHPPIFWGPAGPNPWFGADRSPSTEYPTPPASLLPRNLGDSASPTRLLCNPPKINKVII